MSHKALSASLKNVVIGNGGSTFSMYSFMEGIQFVCTLSISHYYMPCLFTSFDVLSETFLGSMVFEVCQSSLLCFNNPHS